MFRTCFKVYDNNNGLDLNSFISSYKNNVLRYFTDESRGSSSYVPLNYPVPSESSDQVSYKSRKKIMDKMVEICNQPKELGTSVNLGIKPIIVQINVEVHLHYNLT